MQNNCSLQTVPSVSVRKTTPTLGTNYCPHWQPQWGGQGLTVISPFSACSGPAGPAVCVWFVVKRCMLCSLQGCQPGIFYKYWFLSLRKEDPSSSSHSTFRSAVSWFFYVDSGFFFKQTRNPTNQQNESSGRYEFVVQGKMGPEGIGTFKNWGFLFFKLKEIKCVLKNKNKNNSQLIAVEYIREKNSQDYAASERANRCSGRVRKTTWSTV